MSLQWSRFFSKRKILWTRGARYLVVVPSMEPLFFKAENGQPGDSQVSDIPPSMEPLFFKAENPERVASCCWVNFCLQWSRFFSKRKMPNPRLCPSAQDGASMEPLFFKAENPDSSVTVYLRPSSFNGAAFFQSGK